MGYTPLVTRPRDASGGVYSGDPMHITASQLVSTGPTYLGAIIINDPGTSWVLDVYDGTDTNGTKIASIKPTSAGGNFVYDCRLKTGLYINSSGTAGSATVIFSPQ
jgi:hypothetical protein